MGSTLEIVHGYVRPPVTRQFSAIELRAVTEDILDQAKKSASEIFPGDPVKKTIKAALLPQQERPGAFRENTQWIERYVVYADNSRVGMTGLAKLADDENDAVWLEWMGVRPKHERKGIGPQILQATCARAEEIGIPIVRLWTTEDHEKAIKMYLRAGFVLQQTPYEWRDRNAVQMYSMALAGGPVRPYRGKAGDVGFALYGVRKHVRLRLAS